MAHQLDSASAARRSERAGTEQPTTFEQNTVEPGSGEGGLADLGVKALRAQLKDRGLPTSGSKDELVARLGSA